MLLLVVIAAACSADGGPAAAQAAFGSFQDALHRRDEEGLRRLLTNESAAVLATMPWERIQAQAPLEVAGARREGHEFRVEVRDPNSHGQKGEFVVVREYGRLVVDLVATAGLTVEVVEAAGAKEVVEPRELTPADHDRIRQHQLSQPRR